ncbi:hypothetical protein ACGLWX_05870 [Halomonas sp. HMF6819]|uniref:hypothetical protein n=1 Tax=Halomonas sp. HMF6819 TaxID=3373085 RepID=UPI00378B616E
MKKLLGLMAIGLALSGCANNSTYQQPSRSYSQAQPAHAAASASQSEPAKTAYECGEEYGVGTTQGLSIDNVDAYLRCIKTAEQSHGGGGSRFEPIEPGSSMDVDVGYAYYPGELKLSNGNLLRKSQWEALQQIMPAEQARRDVIIDAFSRYWFEYDKFDNSLKVEPLRYISGPYSQTSYVSLRGEVKNGNASGFRLEFKFYGGDWLFANSVRVHADGRNWNSPPLDFMRDHTDKVWEIASIPLSGQGLEIAQRIASGDEVTIRFVGEDYYHDFNVPTVMKEDLSAMLEAISYL